VQFGEISAADLERLGILAGGCDETEPSTTKTSPVSPGRVSRTMCGALSRYFVSM